ncbi:drug/metabolite transporter (DMT)-like permease [Sinobacterium caligoides]|uniref:Drug/metabolite transporter (DMT)-like permease n=1 Tax=Sinobacterium caligoides TaxID=933926 RepID=A0A3N2DMI2_9GAMM|nr:DMT family transporter [Sinobacterium caligoides]ROS01003.1 drug/metabolite transporter (DMT)-like permease [Sinobacterium caligoides]
MNSPSNTTIRRAVTICLAAVSLGTLSAAASKHITPVAGAATIASVQYLVCLILTLPSIRHHGSNSLHTQRLPLHLLRGLSGALCFFIYYTSIEHIPLVEATLLRNSAPLCVPLVVLIMLNQRIARQRWIPLIIGFIGIAIVLRPSDGSLNLYHILGLGAALCYALSMVSTQMLSTTEPNHRILFYYFTISLACLLPFSIGHWREIPLFAWPWLIFIGAALYLSLRLYTYAYSLADAAILSPISYFSVVGAGIIGWAVWGHSPDPLSVIGILLVCTGGISVILIGHVKSKKIKGLPSNGGCTNE